MKTTGIICEYNPFHNGHLYQIQKVRENGADCILCVMSGNFVQRGDVSIVPKQAKAQMAIDAGADLVLELPAVWSLSSAEFFAKGAVSILVSTGICDKLCFGSECGDLQTLLKANEALQDPAIEKRLVRHLENGFSFVAARSKAVAELYGSWLEAVIASPNDILGMEYLKAIENTPIKPFVIQRTVAHDKMSESAFFKSAGEIRELISKEDISFKKAVPPSTYSILKEYASIGQFPVNIENLEQAILAVLRRLDAEDYLNFADVNEGIENRIQQAVMQSKSFREILLRTKSKRYTLARIRRILLNAYLSIGKGYQQSEVPYIRVLGMSNTGKEALKQMQTTAAKPIITRYADFKNADAFAKKVFSLESRATDLYTLAFHPPMPCGTEMTSTVYIKNE